MIFPICCVPSLPITDLSRFLKFLTGYHCRRSKFENKRFYFNLTVVFTSCSADHSSRYSNVKVQRVITMNTIDAGRRKLIVVATGLGVKFLKGGYPFPGSGNPFGYLT